MTVARQEARCRDATAILVAFRHGLRASELCGLEWDQIDLTRKTIRAHVAERHRRPGGLLGLDAIIPYITPSLAIRETAYGLVNNN